jgi:hypothetical protein
MDTFTNEIKSEETLGAEFEQWIDEMGAKIVSEPEELSECCGAPELFPHSMICSHCKDHSGFSAIEE